MLKTIRYVAVLTNKNRVFDRYKEDHRIFGEEYILIQKLDDLRGRYFSRRVLLEGWREISRVDEIMEKLGTRMEIQ